MPTPGRQVNGPWDVFPTTTPALEIAVAALQPAPGSSPRSLRPATSSHRNARVEPPTEAAPTTWPLRLTAVACMSVMPASVPISTKR